MAKATIKLISTSHADADAIANQIKSIAKAAQIKCRGAIPLPRKRIVQAVRKAPSGTGSHTYEKWELRIYKRLLEIDGNEQAFRQIMRIPVPDSVKIEISLAE